MLINKILSDVSKINLELESFYHIFAVQYRGVEQLVARRAHNPKVTGSSPVSATTKSKQVS